jgi:hypothetical protein
MLVLMAEGGRKRQRAEGRRQRAGGKQKAEGRGQKGKGKRERTVTGLFSRSIGPN